jgi:hypothetical protein
MTRRSKKLDQYLNKQVEITFVDGDSRVGILGWNEHLEPLMLIPQRYYLKGSDGAYVSFRKSHVKEVRTRSEDM